MSQIEKLDVKLKHEEFVVRINQRYVGSSMDDYVLFVVASLIPAFLWGWKQGRHFKWMRLLKPAVKFGLLSAVSQVKRQLK